MASHCNSPQLTATHYNALQLTVELWARGEKVAEEDEVEEKMQCQLASAKKFSVSD